MGHRFLFRRRKARSQMKAAFPGWEDYLIGVEMVKVYNTTSNGAIYNLAGQRVNESYKGIVIKDGKKMINK